MYSIRALHVIEGRNGHVDKLLSVVGVCVHVCFISTRVCMWVHVHGYARVWLSAYMYTLCACVFMCV